MKLVLDANALWHRPLILALGDAHAAGLMGDGRVEAVLPAIAYAERIRQIQAGNGDVERWRGDLRVAGISIESFGPEEAHRLPDASLDEGAWRRHARDLLVAAHVWGDREVVTSDNGPAWAGIRRTTPAEACRALEALTTDPEA